MPADDLLGRIALDALAADIPAGDDPGRIEHVQRVVGDAFDQKPETALALEQNPLMLLVFSEHSNPEPLRNGRTRGEVRLVPRTGQL